MINFICTSFSQRTLSCGKWKKRKWLQLRNIWLIWKHLRSSQICLFALYEHCFPGYPIFFTKTSKWAKKNSSKNSGNKVIKIKERNRPFSKSRRQVPFCRLKQESQKILPFQNLTCTRNSRELAGVGFSRHWTSPPHVHFASHWIWKPQAPAHRELP